MFKEKLYSSLPSVFRILVVILFFNSHLVSFKAMPQQTSVIIYVSFFLYIVIFHLIGKHRIMVFFEVTAVMGLELYLKDPILYGLLLVPAVHMMTVERNLFDDLLFTGIVGGFRYYETKEIAHSFLISLGLFICLSIFRSKFSQIDFLQSQLYKERKKSSKVKDEIYSMQRELQTTAKMFERSLLLGNVMQTDGLIEQIIEGSRDLFNADYSCLYIKDENFYIKVRESGKKERYKIAESIPEEEGKEVIIDGKIIRFPIQYEDGDWGVLAVYGKKSDIAEGRQIVYFPFQEEDYEVLLVYMQQVMMMMKHARLLKKMNDLANNDFLTGVPNRRYFMKQLDYMVKRAKRGEPLTVCILDIDHFKKVNDTYGHDVGDEVLKRVASILKEGLREIDIIGRLGGEEFALILPNAKNGDDILVAERIRRKVESTKIPSVHQITISLGVARYEGNATTADIILKNADKALYHAKEGGRNQVIVFDENSDQE